MDVPMGVLGAAFRYIHDIRQQPGAAAAPFRSPRRFVTLLARGRCPPRGLCSRAVFPFRSRPARLAFPFGSPGVADG
jgi:hypothetical protein